MLFLGFWVFRVPRGVIEVPRGLWLAPFGLQGRLESLCLIGIFKGFKSLGFLHGRLTAILACHDFRVLTTCNQCIVNLEMAIKSVVVQVCICTTCGACRRIFFRLLTGPLLPSLSFDSSDGGVTPASYLTLPKCCRYFRPMCFYFSYVYGLSTCMKLSLACPCLLPDLAWLLDSFFMASYSFLNGFIMAP